MPQAIIYLNEDEDKKVGEFSHKWNVSKHDTIKRMIREYKEEKLDG